MFNFPACSFHVANLYYIFILKKIDFQGIIQNWVMANEIMIVINC